MDNQPIEPSVPPQPQPAPPTPSVGGVIADICIALFITGTLINVWYDIFQNIGRRGVSILPPLLSSMLALLVGWGFGFALKPPGNRPYRFWRTYFLHFLIAYGLALTAGGLGIATGIASDHGRAPSANPPFAVLALIFGTGLPIATSLLIFHAAYRRVGHADSWFAGMAGAVRAIFQALVGTTTLVIAAAAFIFLNIMFSPPEE